MVQGIILSTFHSLLFLFVSIYFAFAVAHRFVLPIYRLADSVLGVATPPWHPLLPYPSLVYPLSQQLKISSVAKPYKHMYVCFASVFISSQCDDECCVNRFAGSIIVYCSLYIYIFIVFNTISVQKSRRVRRLTLVIRVANAFCAFA